MVKRSLVLLNDFFLPVAFTDILLSVTVAELMPQHRKICEKFINEYLTS